MLPSRQDFHVASAYVSHIEEQRIMKVISLTALAFVAVAALSGCNKSEDNAAPADAPAAAATAPAAAPASMPADAPAATGTAAPAAAGTAAPAPASTAPAQ
jgi:hypothetical protein